MGGSADGGIHPDLRRIAAFLPRGAVTNRNVALLRQLQRAGERAAAMLGAPRRASRSTSVESIGPITLRLHHPPADAPRPSPALLWIHGGGYVIGTPAQDDRLCRRLAKRLGLLVVAVDYRLAPEHPFPVPLHDCYDALLHLSCRADVDRDRIIVGGASAGGGLAAALAVLARDRGDVTPVLQLLSYPMLDDRTVLRTDIDERTFRLWNNASNAVGWHAYLGAPPGSPDINELAAPARLVDLAGLPPAWIGVGTCDLFHDEDVAYADRLRAAGVPCELDVVDGAFHGFDSVWPRAGITRRFRELQIAAITSATAAR